MLNACSLNTNVWDMFNAEWS